MLGKRLGSYEQAHRSEDQEINRARPLRDGGTLYLNVAPGGSKSWIQRVIIKGRRHDIGLGGYPVVSLADARDKAFENRRLIQRGGDPLAEKRKADVPTFRQAAASWIEANQPRWRGSKTERDRRHQLDKHVMPKLGSLRVDMVTPADVLRCLTPLWTEKPEAARKLRQYIRGTLKWAQAHGYVEHNAAADNIDGALPRQPSVREHHRALGLSRDPNGISGHQGPRI